MTEPRPIPEDVKALLGEVFHEQAWDMWMNTSIGALSGRTPWQRIDAGEKWLVLALLNSYADGGFA